jgi:outer membrane protein OmpA-like peptidoglycan-associated protein
MDLLLGQKDNIKAALPAGVSSLLGVSDLDRLGLKEVTAAATPVKKNFTWLLVLIGLGALLFFLWRSCSPPPPVMDVGEKVVGESSEALDSLGKFFSKKLPNGVELSIPEFGVENKLITFIEDAQLPVDDKTWFSLDRLTFETGKAILKPESQEQLKNIAEILKAYPKVSIKLGGYTDNTGDPQVNLKLSQQRADTVMADLVKMGIDASRLEAEGYGQEHPVADNSTEEGRAKNRRIDMRVTAK